MTIGELISAFIVTVINNSKISMMKHLDKANETDGVMGAVVCIMNHNTVHNALRIQKKLFIKNYV